MPNPSVSSLPPGASNNSNANEAAQNSIVPTPTFTRQPHASLPTTTNQLQFAPPAFPQPIIPEGLLFPKRKLAFAAQEAKILNLRYEPNVSVAPMSSKDLRYIRELAITNLTNAQLAQLKDLVKPHRTLVNKTFFDRGGSDNVRNILMGSFERTDLQGSAGFLRSMMMKMGDETPVNTNAMLGVYHAGNAYRAENNKPFKGSYEHLKEFVPEELRESTNYLFENPPTMSKYLLPDFDKIIAANPGAMLPLGSNENTDYWGLESMHLVPRRDLYSFLEARSDQPQSKHQRTDAPVVAPAAQDFLIPPTPQGLPGLPTPAPIGNAGHGGGTRSSTADVMPMPRQLPNAQASAINAGADGDLNSLFNRMQQDWHTTLQPSSAPPFTHTTQSTATATATATAIRPQVLPGNPSAPTVSQGPVLSVAPSHLNGSQNQISSQQAPSQFANIDAFIAQRLDEIRRHEMSAPQVTSVDPQYQASMLPPAAQAPNNWAAGNVPSNPVPSANPAALQPDHSYNDLLALIDSLPVMEPGASTAHPTFNQPVTFNQPAPFNQQAPLHQASTFNPALPTAPTGQLSNVWAQPTVAQAWNGGSTNAPQFVNPNQAYPQPFNQPQAPSQALVMMPGMYPTANSQFPTNFSNNPPFNSSFAPNPLVPSNSFHDYSQLLHQPQPQPQQQHQQQPQQNMAAPAFYSSMPMNSYSAQQINQYNGPSSNYFAVPATNYSFMPGNSMPATAMGASAMPGAPANSTSGTSGAGSTGSTGAPSAYPYQW